REETQGQSPSLQITSSHWQLRDTDTPSLSHTHTRPLLLSLFLTFPVCLSFEHYPCFSLTHIHYVSSCLHYLYLFSLIFSLSSLTPFPSLFIVIVLPPVCMLST